ncbi:Rpn family recombination-promoting nuclease/putative transposase [Clostridium sp. FP2]|uniref:Rpn family recombination-promoting nuclease/putative transposase n=1 Tax=Clostridium sp. FP2 TaxID=2724481 RepID=UPI0021E20AE0|nr:Rpn family recombination-promoting nuclease/putative transposase [Clostridium sp. FP2]
MTDVLEVHFLELPKLFKEDIEKDENDPIVEWMEFLDGKSKGVMEMLASKNENIKKAYDLLQVISQDENARMAYEARETEIRDQMMRIKSAEERGKMEIATNLLKLGVSVDIIIKATGLSEEKVIQIKKELES